MFYIGKTKTSEKQNNLPQVSLCKDEFSRQMIAFYSFAQQCFHYIGVNGFLNFEGKGISVDLSHNQQNIYPDTGK